jgi:hypothetical protein
MSRKLEIGVFEGLLWHDLSPFTKENCRGDQGSMLRSQFFSEILAVFSKTRVLIKFWQKNSTSLSKKPPIFGKNIFNIIKSVPESWNNDQTGTNRITYYVHFCRFLAFFLKTNIVIIFLPK